MFRPLRTIGKTASLWICARSIVRAVVLSVWDCPQTPLRSLCVAALDSVRVLRGLPRMSLDQRRLLLSVIHFGANLNESFDGKPARDCASVTKDDHLGSHCAPILIEYSERLKRLESARQFAHVREYRESVARLSIGVLVAVALDLDFACAGIHAVTKEDDLAILFRIVMQCQIIDDVLDYNADVALSLPSFLNTQYNLVDAYQDTIRASQQYADLGLHQRTPALFPFRLMLRLVSLAAGFVIAIGRWRHSSTSAPGSIGHSS